MFKRIVISLMIISVVGGWIYAGEIGTGNVSTGSALCYPYVYDTRHVETIYDIMRIEVPNDQNAALLNHQWTLGILPQGPYPTVRARLDDIQSSTIAVQIQIDNLETSTGNINADLQNSKDLIGKATAQELIERTNQDILIGQCTGQHTINVSNSTNTIWNAVLSSFTVNDTNLTTVNNNSINRDNLIGNATNELTLNIRQSTGTNWIAMLSSFTKVDGAINTKLDISSGIEAERLFSLTGDATEYLLNQVNLIGDCTEAIVDNVSNSTSTIWTATLSSFTLVDGAINTKLSISSGIEVERLLNLTGEATRQAVIDSIARDNLIGEATRQVVIDSINRDNLIGNATGELTLNVSQSTNTIYQTVQSSVGANYYNKGEVDIQTVLVGDATRYIQNNYLNLNTGGVINGDISVATLTATNVYTESLWVSSIGYTINKSTIMYTDYYYSHLNSYQSFMSDVNIARPYTLSVSTIVSASNNNYFMAFDRTEYGNDTLTVSAPIYMRKVGQNVQFRIYNSAQTGILVADVDNNNDLSFTHYGGNILFKHGNSAVVSTMTFGTGNLTIPGVFKSVGTDGNYFAGNIGINTTNPTNKLEVIGSISNSGQIYSSGTASNYFAGNIEISDNSDVSKSININSGENTMGQLGFWAFPGYGIRLLYDDTSTKEGLHFMYHTGGDLNGISTMFIRRTTGNIGIGNINPIQKLHLSSGTVFIDGDVANSIITNGVISGTSVTVSGNLSAGNTVYAHIGNFNEVFTSTIYGKSPVYIPGGISSAKDSVVINSTFSDIVTISSSPTGFYPSSCSANVGNFGPGWYNIDNVYNGLGNYAVIYTSESGGGPPPSTSMLESFGYNFNITSGSITGIKVSFTFETVSESAKAYVYVRKSSGTSFYYGIESPMLTGLGTLEIGNSSELWGTTWTKEEISSASFGTGISIRKNMIGPGYDVEFRLYTASITVYTSYNETIITPVSYSRGKGFYVDSVGNIGVGVSTPTDVLVVDGNIIPAVVSSAPYIGCNLGSANNYWNQIHYKTAITHSIEDRISENDSVITMLKIKTGKKDTYGDAYIPKKKNKKGEWENAGTDLNKLMEMMIKTIQFQGKQIDNLKKQIKELKEK